MRSANAIRNATVSIAAQVFNMLLSFVCRTIFVRLLATEYLGLSGLFSNVLSVLSLSELGIGNAIIINLYKPMADKDEDTVTRYMNYYSKAYKVIGCVILAFGLLTTPFLQYIVNTDVDIPNLRLIYFLFVANSAISYFCAYKRTILTVDQKEYINTINRNIFLLLQNVLQILVLWLTRNYVLYVSIMLLCTMASNLYISAYANKIYPFLENKAVSLDQAQKNDLVRSIKVIMLQKIGNVLVNSTDNIIISLMLGVYWVGMYSNYSMIVGIIVTFSTIIFAACSASIGNLNAAESSEKVYNIFRVMTVLGLWIYGFCSICFLCLFQPFICIWIGPKYLLDFTTLIFIILAFFLKGLIGISSTFLDVTKLFVHTRWIPLIMALVNIGASVIGTYYWGLRGVFLGTVISYITTQLWINPVVLYKYKFEKSIWSYILFLLPRVFVLMVAVIITFLLSGLTDNFVCKLLVCIVTPNMVLLTLFKTEEMKYLRNLIKMLLRPMITSHFKQKG
jgi:O-antigen/teichoic acid export membrane protein